MNKEEAEIFVGLLERITAIVGIVDSFTEEEMRVLIKAKEVIINGTDGQELNQQQLIAINRVEIIETLRKNLLEAKKEYQEEKREDRVLQDKI